MDIRTFRAKTMQEALDQVRRSLGADAAVLHTREINNGLLRRMLFGTAYEVAASATVNVPSRLPSDALFDAPPAEPAQVAEPIDTPDPWGGPQLDYAAKYRSEIRREVGTQLDELQAMVEKLCDRNHNSSQPALPEALFHAFTDMIEADIEEPIAREMIERVRSGAAAGDLIDPLLIKSRIAQHLESEIQATGALRLVAGERRLVALIGPTGVGKTTTIAKLAANYRLREKKRVGLITVDTYRVAAVEQLRTYADIIDLPMEVVSTPREMREAADRMQDLDLVLMDTAGRSPRDEIKIQELKSMLTEARPDEVQLVLSSTSGANGLAATASRFADAGATGLILTKLDEATGLGHLVSLVRKCQLPLSYLTDGQNVPDDIAVADPHRLAYLMLGMEK